MGAHPRWPARITAPYPFPPTHLLALRARLPLLVFLAVAPVSAASEELTQPLFVIQRSKNANEVHYDARVLASGQLDEKNPIDAYWLLKAEDGSRKPISQLQNIAYGFSVGAPVEGRYPLTLKAFSGTPMALVRAAGQWKVQMTISGQAATLQRIFVTTDESGTLPKVVSIDLFGQDLDGKPVQEHIAK